MVTRRSGLARSHAPRAPNPEARPDTRTKLVRTAEKLMLRDGYSATRVDDVIRSAGLSKGSFYHFFDSKDALGLAALEHYCSDRIGRLAAGPYARETDPVRRARGVLEHASRVAADLWTNGCLLASLSADAAGSDRAISNELRKRTNDLRALLVDVLGPLATPESSGADLADRFLVCVEGSIVLARIYGDPSYVRRGIEGFVRDLDR